MQKIKYTMEEGKSYKKPSNERFLSSFGRRIGKRLGVGQKELLQNILPQISIQLPDNGALTPQNIFTTKPDRLWMEIGFGGGEFLAEQIKRHPDIGFIGCEPYLNGVANLLKLLQGNSLGNVRIWADDARDLLQKLTPASLDKVFILFPDPWPKTRHHKRRIISDRMLDLLHEKLSADGQLVLATDHKEYAEWMLEHVTRHPGFEWLAKSPNDWKEPPEGWVATKYETKTRAWGSEPVFLKLKKIPRA
jgi:tRNA (guanine-N7-)-methyltransferase